MTATEGKMHAYQIASDNCLKMAAKLSPDKVQLAMANLSIELKKRSASLRKTLDRAAKKKTGKQK